MKNIDLYKIAGVLLLSVIAWGVFKIANKEEINNGRFVGSGEGYVLIDTHTGAVYQISLSGNDPKLLSKKIIK